MVNQTGVDREVRGPRYGRACLRVVMVGSLTYHFIDWPRSILAVSVEGHADLFTIPRRSVVGIAILSE
jgi:hypothetical protein